MILANKSFEEVCKEQGELFSLDFLTCSFRDKLALISMVCYVTNELNKKRSEPLTCYDILLKIDASGDQKFREEFLKGLAGMCQNFMKWCDSFETFGVSPKEMPKAIRKILDFFLPF